MSAVPAWVLWGKGARPFAHGLPCLTRAATEADAIALADRKLPGCGPWTVHPMSEYVDYLDSVDPERAARLRARWMPGAAS